MPFTAYPTAPNINDPATFPSRATAWWAHHAGVFVPELTAAMLAYGPGAPWCTVGGTANAITLTSGLSIGSLAAGQGVRFLAGSTNAGAVTLNLDGLGAAAATDYAGAALPAGFVVSGRYYEAVYTGSAWVLWPASLNPLALLSTGSLGYAAGAGGTVTQVTSKATSVTLNKACGQITTHNAALAAGASVSFTVNNSTVNGEDTVAAFTVNNAVSGSYRVEVHSIGTGVFSVRLTNITGGSLSDAITLVFGVIQGVTA